MDNPMTVRTNQLNRLAFLPIANPTVLITFPVFILTVWMVNIQSNHIIKTTQLALIAKIRIEFCFIILVILFFFGTSSLGRIYISLFSAIIRTITISLIFCCIATYRTLITMPSAIQIAFHRAKLILSGRDEAFSYSKLFATTLTNKCSAIKTVFSYRGFRIKFFSTLGTSSWFVISHNKTLYSKTIYMSNKIKEYCEIARQRVKAVETGVPVAEQRIGQMGLFEKGE